MGVSTPNRVSHWLLNLRLNTYMQIAGSILVLPAVVLLCVLLLGPFLFVIWNSFIEKETVAFGLGNYQWLLGPAFLPSLLNTLLIGVGSVTLEILVAVPLALLLNQQLVGRGFWRALITLPWAVPTISVAAAFSWLSNTNYGIFNQLGLAIGILKAPIAFLGDPKIALTAVIVAHAWKGLPLAYIIIFAALQSLPLELLEAAKVDGAWRWNQLRFVILPHLSSAIGLAAVLSGIYNFALFDLTFLLTGGGPAGRTMTLPLLEYNQMFRTLNTGRASAIGVVIFLAGVIALLVQYQWTAHDRQRRSAR